jgi:hypothetical protein
MTCMLTPLKSFAISSTCAAADPGFRCVYDSVPLVQAAYDDLSAMLLMLTPFKSRKVQSVCHISKLIGEQR